MVFDPSGRVLTAAEGERANLCQYLVPAGQSLERAKSLAGGICKNARFSRKFFPPPVGAVTPYGRRLLCVCPSFTISVRQLS